MIDVGKLLGRDFEKGFGVYFDASKTTSGQRFYSALHAELKSSSIPLEKKPMVVLFNISAPIKPIILAKIRRQKIVLRVDGLYFDRLSPVFIQKFSFPIRSILMLGLVFKKLHDPLALFANFVDQNYTAFFRIFLADHLIYQSTFSMVLHQKYFPNKNYDMVVNGAQFANPELRHNVSDDNVWRLITIYDGWKPAKRLYDLLCFVRWMNNGKHACTLTVLGYTGNVPDSAPSDMRGMLEDSSYVKTMPHFSEFSEKMQEELFSSHCFITFSYRDPCPNVVVECMAYGLPVIAPNSGGLPDIVGDAGILFNVSDDFIDGFFSPYRFESNFLLINFDSVFAALSNVIVNLDFYKSRVRLRFAEKLGIDIVAYQYKSILNRFCK